MLSPLINASADRRVVRVEPRPCKDSIAHVRFIVRMKGAYCLLMLLEEDTSLCVGALGRVFFPKGVYAYVGSAQGGIEQRVRRHLGETKRKRWHIDHFLSVARTVTVVSIPTDRKSSECITAKSLLRSPTAQAVVRGFGSSDCRCESHLIHFKGDEYDDILEMVVGHVSMFFCPYPETLRPA